MNRHSLRSFLALLLFSLLHQSACQQTFQQKPWLRRAARPHFRTTPQPRSGRTTYGVPRTSAGPRQTTLTSRYLDYDDWATDKKARLWDVKLNNRRPNRYSWTSKIVFANVAMYALQVWKPSVTSLGVKLSDRILRGEELYRLISPVFLHGSVYHLFTNMYSLQRLGNFAEQMFGPGRFLTGYLAAGAAGNLLSAINSPNPALGASGAVFGVMAGFWVFLNRHDWLLGQQGDAFSGAIMQTFLMNLAIGYFNPMVDNWGHLGGALGGAAMAYYFGPRLFLTELPDGNRSIVDRPIIRLPRAIESIPGRTGNMLTRMTRRMQIWRFKADLPAKPWRPKRKNGAPLDYQRRMNTPNQSIRPED